MNRLILIGNGFDLAHDLKTSYANFIDWYKSHLVEELKATHTNSLKTPLFSIELIKKQALSIYINNFFWNNQKASNFDLLDYIVDNTTEFSVIFSPFFERIIKSVETKNWVDIEEEYYELLKEFALKNEPKNNLHGLNEQMLFIQNLLVKYLKEVDKTQSIKIQRIEHIISSPIEPREIATSESNLLLDHVNYRIKKSNSKEEEYLEKESQSINEDANLRCPIKTMLLSFNYTSTLYKYPELLRNANFSTIHIHGDIIKPESIIFGYGDELDENFKNLKEHGDKESLRNIKSIRYLETPNYRQVLLFINSAPFQVFIMGHSCGNSDRTLLNTLFEHKNCISIKPYFYQKSDGTDNYLELVQNISRNFNDMKLMRDRVVNKTFCDPLPQAQNND